MPDMGQLVFRTAMLAATSGRQRLSVLIYHRVVNERDWMRPALPTVDEFRWQMGIMRHHFNLLPLPEAVTRLRDGSLPPRAACITFDDGFADNATVAFPVLQEYQIPVTIFVATGYLDGGRMWNDTLVEATRMHPEGELDLSPVGLPRYVLGDPSSRRGAAYDIIRRSKYLEGAQRQDVVDFLGERVGRLTEDLMMTSEQVRQLSGQGVEIGGHTVSHPILARLSPEDAQQEITEGRAQLEALIDRPVRFFAYPNGKPESDYNSEHVAMVKKAGFEAALTTGWGVATQKTDLFQLPRFTPWERTRARFLARMLINSRGTHTLRQ